MHKILRKIVTLNNTLQPLLEEKKWEEVLQFATERDQYIKQYFELSPLPDSPETISEVTSYILENDTKISRAITEDKTSLIDESLSLQMNRNAIRQYQSNQSK